MKRKHQKTLELIFARPVSANVRWADIEALLLEFGATIEEREGSRVLIKLFNERRVFHRPPIDKGVLAVRRQLSCPIGDNYNLS